MGVSNSPQELAGKLQAFAKDVGNVRVPLNVTALHVKTLMQASAASAGALGSKPAGKRRLIGVRYDLKGSGQRMVAVVGYTGPAHLINNPTQDHPIRPRGRRGGRGRRRGALALTINGNLRPFAHHPGTTGKRFYEKAKAVAERTAPRVYARKGLTEPLRRNF